MIYPGVGIQESPIKIDLYKHDAYYTDRDPVIGEVHIDLRHRDCINSVELGLCGIIEEVGPIGKDDAGNERWGTMLFQRRIVLHERRDLTHRSHIWPFSIEFPSQVEAVGHPIAFEYQPEFESAPGHRLPPTELDNRYRYRQGTVKKIKYYIEAVVQDPCAPLKHATGKRRTFEHRVYLQFMPTRLEPNPSPLTAVERRRFVFETRRFLRPGTVPVLPLQKGMEHYVFTVQTSIPTQVYLSGPFPLAISIEPDLNQSTAKLPDAYIYKYWVNLVATTHFRDPYGKAPGSMRRIIGQAAGFGPGIDLQGLWRNEITPTFKTYTWSTSYTLEVRAEVLCGGRKFEVRPGVEELVILPCVYKRPPAPEYTEYLESDNYQEPFGSAAPKKYKITQPSLGEHLVNGAGSSRPKSLPQLTVLAPSIPDANDHSAEYSADHPPIHEKGGGPSSRSFSTRRSAVRVSSDEHLPSTEQQPNSDGLPEYTGPLGREQEVTVS